VGFEFWVQEFLPKQLPIEDKTTVLANGTNVIVKGLIFIGWREEEIYRKTGVIDRDTKPIVRPTRVNDAPTKSIVDPTPANDDLARANVGLADFIVVRFFDIEADSWFIVKVTRLNDAPTKSIVEGTNFIV